MIMVLLISSFGLGQSMSTMGDSEKTAAAMRNIFRLLDRQPTIDSASEEGTKLNTPLSGDIEFDGVHFTCANDAPRCCPHRARRARWG